MAGADLKRRVWRWLRFGALGVAILVAIPLVLVPVYAIVRPISVPMMMRFVTLQPVTRVWRPLDEVSDRLKATIIMGEDGQFCRHHGVDFGALRAEYEAWQAGKRPRGASTVSMQVARNLFLWNGRSYVRKALELPLSIYLDFVLSKRRIMEIYLNIAEWGPDGEFGIEAGAQRAFGVDADSFSWERAGLLVITLPNPHVRNPARPSRGMVRIGGIITRRARAAEAPLSCLFEPGQVPVQ